MLTLADGQLFALHHMVCKVLRRRRQRGIGGSVKRFSKVTSKLRSVMTAPDSLRRDGRMVEDWPLRSRSHISHGLPCRCWGSRHLENASVVVKPWSRSHGLLIPLPTELDGCNAGKVQALRKAHGRRRHAQKSRFTTFHERP